jgi:hypothetical protein
MNRAALSLSNRWNNHHAGMMRVSIENFVKFVGKGGSIDRISLMSPDSARTLAEIAEAKKATAK